MGAKSLVVQSSIGLGGSLFGAGADYCTVGTGGAIEDDSNTAFSIFGADCTISAPQLFLTANSLSVDMDFTLYQNGSPTSCVVTIPASGNPTGWITGTGTIDVDAGDNIIWRCEDVGGNDVNVTMAALVVESDTSSAITKIHVNSAGSLNLNGDGSTYYLKPLGHRSTEPDEDDVTFQFPIAGTLSHFYVSTGVVARTSTCTAKVRVNGADGNQVVTWDDSDTLALLLDDSNTETLTARDGVTYTAINGAGSGEANNLEKLGSTLVNGAGDFFIANAIDYRQNQDDGLTRYYPVGGSLSFGGTATESQAELDLPLAINVSELFIRVTDEIMNDDSTLVIRKNGTDVGTAITISGAGGSGYHYQAQDIDFDEGDTICFRIITGASGTRIRIGHMGIVAREIVGGTPLEVASLSHGQGLDNVALTQAHTLAVSDMSHGQSLENVDLSQEVTLSVADVAHGQSLDGVALTQDHSLSVDDVSHGQSLDSVALDQAHVLLVGDLSHSQSLESVGLTQSNVLSVNGIQQGQSLDNVILTVAGSLAVQYLSQGQSLGNVDLTQHNALSVDDIAQAMQIDNVGLVQHYALVVADLLQGQSIESLTLDADSTTLSVDGLTHSQTLDSVALTEYAVLTVDNLSHGQLLDVVNFGGVVVGRLNGEIVVYSALGGTVTINP